MKVVQKLQYAICDVVCLDALLYLENSLSSGTHVPSAKSTSLFQDT